MEIEQLRGSVVTGEDDAPSLQVAGNEENEFVRNYLQQRQKLLSQQLEQKKRFEEEASRSQSECETEDGDSAVKLAEQQNLQQPEALNQSDEDTDVETPQDLSEQQTDASTVKPDSNMDSVAVEQSNIPEQDEAAVVISSENLSGAGDDGEAESHGNKPETVSSPRRSSTRSKSRSRSRSGSRSQNEPQRSPSHHSVNSRSRSRTPPKSRSQSNNSRSSSGERSVARSRSPSAESRPGSVDKRLEDRAQSASESSDRSRSPSLDRSSAMETSTVEPVAGYDGNKDGGELENVQQPTELRIDDSLPALHSTVSEVMETDQPLTGCNELDKQVSNKDEGSTRSRRTNDDKSQTDDGSAADTTEVSAAEVVKPARKRRWGSSAVQTVKPSIVISTDSLKGLIPDIDPASISIDTPIELDEAGDASSKDQQSAAGEPSGRAVVVKSYDASEQTDTRAAKIRRTVCQESASSEAPVDKSDEEEIKEESEKNESESTINVTRVVKPPVTEGASDSKKTEDAGQQVRVSRTLSLTVEDPVDVGRKSPSPSRHPPSNVVHVTGLVRPFTLGQLKELLGRTGNLQPDGFWIDNIKSHCYVVYENVEQAVATRRALHGKRWPASNPKLLGVDFRTMDEFEKRKNNVLIHSVDSSSNKPATQQPPVESKREQEKPAAGVENRKDPIKPSRETSKPLVKESKEKTSAAPVREWDRHKLRQSRSVSRERLRKEDRAKVEGRDKREPSRHEQQRSRDDRRGRGRTDKPVGTEQLSKNLRNNLSEGSAKVEEEPPAKLLDDLFRKTVAMPCIYWLPLTDEQVKEKLAQEKQEKLLREQRRAEREQQFEAERQQRLKERARQEQSRGSERDRQPAHRRRVRISVLWNFFPNNRGTFKWASQ